MSGDIQLFQKYLVDRGYFISEKKKLAALRSQKTKLKKQLKREQEVLKELANKIIETKYQQAELISGKLERYRQLNGLTIKELANEVGIPFSSMNYVLNSVRLKPKNKYFKKCVDFLQKC